MYERLEQALQIHKMCLKELHILQNNVEGYLLASNSLSDMLQDHWHEVRQGNSLALMVYDNFLTSITNIMNSARKFNIQIQLNNLKSIETHNIHSGISEIQENALEKYQKRDTSIKDVDKTTLVNSSKVTIQDDKILYPAEEFSENLEYGEEFVYPKINLNTFYKKNTIIKASVTYIKDLNNMKFYIMDISSQFIKNVVETAHSIELHQYHSIPPVDEIFGLALDECILRAVRYSKVLYDQEQDEEFWPCYLIDLGEVVRLKTENITYKLREEQKMAPALGILCQLKSPKTFSKNPFVDQKEMENKLQNLLFHNCVLRVISIKDNMLQVELLNDPSQKNKEILNKKTIPLINKKDSNPFRESIKNDKPKFNQEELEMLYEEPLNTSNAMKAVMGYDPQDDKRICRFYDPKTGGCFKGSRCKQEHVPRQPDGWTKDIVPAASIIDNRSPLVIYPEGKIINITPTYIGHFDKFYAQINDPRHNSSPLIWNAEDVPSWKLLQKPPHIYELVLSRYEDGLWYRAQILTHDDEYKMFKVFYVDYGNHQIVHLRNLARIDSSMAQIPFQAILCRLAGIKEVKVIPADQRKNGIKLLCEMILNNSIDVKVVSHYEDLLISFPNKRDLPIQEILLDMKCVELSNS